MVQAAGSDVIKALDAGSRGFREIHDPLLVSIRVSWCANSPAAANGTEMPASLEG